MGSKFLSTSSRPNSIRIGVLDFANSLLRHLDVNRVSRRQRNGAQQQNIGLAISGGVDSMALAWLCSQLKTIPPGETESHYSILRDIRFRAFVVDHGLRLSSGEEAQSVSEILQERGISTDILKIDWKKIGIPTATLGLESSARKLRFQALGNACKQHSISTLLLAHHKDDQAETVFMRLANGHGPLGLAGIKSHSSIPECYGMHGIHESGGSEDEKGMKQSMGWSNLAHAFRKSKQLRTEDGGVEIYRPLLEFSKAQLQATCKNAGMRWFEDHTNKDPTFTPRNAVRSIFNNYDLPPALTKPVLLDLSSRCKEKRAYRNKATSLWLRKCYISRFETRSGILVIEFPNLRSLGGVRAKAPYDDFSGSEGTEQTERLPWDKNPSDIQATDETDTLASEKHLLDAQTINQTDPRTSDHGSLSFRSLEGADTTPSGQYLFDTHETTQSDTKFADRQIIAAMLLRRVIKLITPEQHVLLSSLQHSVDFVFPELNNHGNSNHQKSFTVAGVLFRRLDGNMKWRISRQPPSHFERHKKSIEVKKMDSEGSWTPWSLFDGRYWIRVKNASGTDMEIKFLEKEQLHDFFEKFRGTEKSKLKILAKAKADLKSLAPDLVRFTLPVIVLNKEVIGLPSLGLVAPGYEKMIAYKIRYKKLDLEGPLFTETSTEN